MGQGCGGAHLGEGQSHSHHITRLPTLVFFFPRCLTCQKKCPPFFLCRCSAWMARWCFWWVFRKKIDVVVFLVLFPVRGCRAQKPLPLLASLLQEHVFWVVSLNTLFILVFGESAKAGRAAITLKSEQGYYKMSGLSSKKIFNFLNFFASHSILSLPHRPLLRRGPRLRGICK